MDLKQIKSILKSISKKWVGIDKESKELFAESLVGMKDKQKFIALMNNYTLCNK